MFDSVLAQIEQSDFALEIAQSAWLFPTIEIVHVLALTIVFGSIAMVDLRLLNRSLRERDVAELTKEVLPWTWIAFVVAAISGSLMFVSAATKYAHLLPFQLKMGLLVAAGINMAIFHLVAYRSVADWGKNPVSPLSARIAGATSLFLWISIVACGRVIGFL